MKIKEIIGRNIRRHREGLGIRQGALAQQLSITPSALSQIETGKTDISVDRIEQIAGALKLSFYEHLLIDKIDTLLQSGAKKEG
jgi:transcriptional regulator with XRE-family HTH domain